MTTPGMMPPLNNALIVENSFHAVHLLIAEYLVIFVVKQKHAHAVRLKHVVFRQMQIGI